MADTFLSPPLKRPFRMLDPYHHPPPHTTSTTLDCSASKRSKRSKQPSPASLVVPAGQVSLRLLCHESLVGAFIGKSGSTIKQLQLETASKIRVEDSLQSGSDHRVIVLVAANTPFKKLKLPKTFHAQEQVEYEVSAAQEAALRVFEKVLEISADIERAPKLSCRFLVGASQAGSVIGKGGKVVEKIKKDSGARIRVLLGDHLPPGVPLSDEVVEIEGDVLAVKKALLSVSGRLQECSTFDKPSVKENSRQVESTSHPRVVDLLVDPPLQRTPLSVATTSSSPAMVGRPLSFDAQRLSTSDLNSEQQEMVFKILCSNDRVGAIIGRGGSIIRALQDETGATINIGASVADCDERLVTITSKEDVGSGYSPAQRAVILVFCRYVEAAMEKSQESGSNNNVAARLVVLSNQVGCLLGKGGAIVSEMRKATGAGIRVNKGDQVPKCASENDVVVEISGQFVNVQDALYQVTSRLRNDLFAKKVINSSGLNTNSPLVDTSLHGRVGDPASIGLHQSFSKSQSIDRLATLRHGLDPLLHPHRFNQSPSPVLRTSDISAGVKLRTSVNLAKGLASANGVELGSANRTAIVTNTTVEILIPESAVSSVYGENGSNLARIRQISGAKVVVHEAHLGARDRTVIISGTPDETQAAQSLIHAFILTGQS